MTNGSEIRTNVGAFAIELVAFRTNVFKYELAATAVSGLVQSFLVLSYDLRSFALTAFQDRAHCVSNRRVPVHHELTLVAERKRPRLNPAVF